MPRFARLEIWTDLACNGGVRQAFVPDVLAASDVHELEQPGELRVTLRRLSEAWAHLVEHKVLRVVFGDDTFDEWRITGFEEQREGNALLGVVRAAGVLQDLQHGLVERTEADGLVTGDFGLNGLTPTALLTTILASARSYFGAGTVDPTVAADVDFRTESPLSALRALALQAAAELQVRRNGTTNYLVDLLTQVGAGAATSYLRVGRNIVGWQRTRTTDQHATRIYGAGGGEELGRLTIAGARWTVAAITGSDVTLADPVTGLPGPIRFDDQLNGCYLRKVGAGSATQITDSVASTQKVTVASVAGLAVTDTVIVEKNAAGDDLTYLEDPASKALYGLLTAILERGDLPPVHNHVANPLLNGTYTSGLPAGWSKVGAPTTSEETDARYTRHGGKSLKVVAGADGQGVVCAAAPITPTADRPLFSGYPIVIVTSGKVRIELVDSTGGVAPTGGDKAIVSELNVWHEEGVAGIDLFAVSATSAQLRILADGGAATFYVDGAQITQSASQEAFFPGTGANQLWHAINDTLEERAVPAVSIDVDVVDFFRENPAAWPDAELVLGGPVSVTDSDTGLAISTRILRLERDLLTDRVSAVRLSSAPEDLTDSLVRPQRRRRPPGEPIVTEPKAPPVRLISVWYFWRASRLYVQWNGDTGVQSVKVAVSTTSQPAAGTGTANNPVGGNQGVFDAGTFVYGDTVYVTVTPYGAASAAGAQGPADVNFTRLSEADGQWDETTGKRKRTAPFDDNGYALRAADTAGKEAFDDLWIPSTKAPKVGTVASPGAIPKTMRIPFSAFVAESDTSQYQYANNNRYLTMRSNLNVRFACVLVLPPGVTVTDFKMRSRANYAGAAGGVIGTLLKADDSGAAPSALCTLSNEPGAASSSWVTTSGTLSEVVGASSTYLAHVQMYDSVNGSDTLAFLWAELTYTMPSYDKGL